MNDIVEWLRKEAELIALDRLSEAADEIERLRAALSAVVPVRIKKPRHGNRGQGGRRRQKWGDGQKLGKK